MDPVDFNDTLTNELRKTVIKIVKEINNEYSIHDFRIVSGTTHTNLIFDVLIPSNDQIEHKILKEQINRKIKAIDSSYYTIIQIEHSYV